MKSLSLSNSYEVRLLALVAILAAYYWPDSWFWCLGGFLLAWLILGRYSAFKSVDLRYFKQGPQELIEVSLMGILLHGFSLVTYVAFWLERQFIGYLHGVVTVAVIALCLFVLAFCLFGLEQLDDLADKTN